MTSTRQRAAVLELEALEADDAKLGLVVLSTDGEADLVDGRADPEGVTRMVASRTLAGGAIGALVGRDPHRRRDAAVRRRERSTAIVAAIGGAFIGGVFGAIWVVFAGMGGSDAYRQSFIAPELTDVCIVSLHTDDPDRRPTDATGWPATAWLTIVDVDVNGCGEAPPITRMGDVARLPANWCLTAFRGGYGGLCSSTCSGDGTD